LQFDTADSQAGSHVTQYLLHGTLGHLFAVYVEPSEARVFAAGQNREFALGSQPPRGRGLVFEKVLPHAQVPQRPRQFSPPMIHLNIVPHVATAGNDVPLLDIGTHLKRREWLAN
jgi:hypothetical protein